MVFVQDGNDRPKKRGRYLAWGDPDVDDDNVPRTTLYRRGLQVQNDQATSVSLVSCIHTLSVLDSFPFFKN